MADLGQDKEQARLMGMQDLGVGQNAGLGDQQGVGLLGVPPTGPSPVVSASATPRTGSVPGSMDVPGFGGLPAGSPAPRPPQSPGAFGGVLDARRRSSPGFGSVQQQLGVSSWPSQQAKGGLSQAAMLQQQLLQQQAAGGLGNFQPGSALAASSLLNQQQQQAALRNQQQQKPQQGAPFASAGAYSNPAMLQRLIAQQQQQQQLRQGVASQYSNATSLQAAAVAAAAAAAQQQQNQNNLLAQATLLARAGLLTPAQQAALIAQLGGSSAAQQGPRGISGLNPQQQQQAAAALAAQLFAQQQQQAGGIGAQQQAAAAAALAAQLAQRGNAAGSLNNAAMLQQFALLQQQQQQRGVRQAGYQPGSAGMNGSAGGYGPSPAARSTPPPGQFSALEAQVAAQMAQQLGLLGVPPQQQQGAYGTLGGGGVGGLGPQQQQPSLESSAPFLATTLGQQQQQRSLYGVLGNQQQQQQEGYGARGGAVNMGLPPHLMSGQRQQARSPWESESSTVNNQQPPADPVQTLQDIGQTLAQLRISVEAAVGAGLLGGLSASDVRVVAEAHARKLLELGGSGSRPSSRGPLAEGAVGAVAGSIGRPLSSASSAARVPVSLEDEGGDQHHTNGRRSADDQYLAGRPFPSTNTASFSSVDAGLKRVSPDDADEEDVAFLLDLEEERASDKSATNPTTSTPHQQVDEALIAAKVKESARAPSDATQYGFFGNAGGEADALAASLLTELELGGDANDAEQTLTLRAPSIPGDKVGSGLSLNVGPQGLSAPGLALQQQVGGPGSVRSEPTPRGSTTTISSSALSLPLPDSLFGEAPASGPQPAAGVWRPSSVGLPTHTTSDSLLEGSKLERLWGGGQQQNAFGAAQQQQQDAFSRLNVNWGTGFL